MSISRIHVFVTFISLTCLVFSITWSLASSSSKKNNLSLFASKRVKNLNQVSPWVQFGSVKARHMKHYIDLGQGFANYDAAPEYLMSSLRNISTRPDFNLSNQYTHAYGHPRLIKSLVEYYKRRAVEESKLVSIEQNEILKNLNDPRRQIIVTVGAYEALFASIMAFIDDKDEVILIEPTFDAYAPMVKMAGGKCVYVSLKLKTSINSSLGLGVIAGGQSNTTLPPNKQQNQLFLNSQSFELDFDELKSKISNKTKALILNTPNNPLGKVYSRRELEFVGKLAQEHNFIVIADEVYDQLYYSNSNNDLEKHKHVSIASLPNMWQRTITIGSVGKTFSVTGWKVGWALGAEQLIKPLQLVHQNSIFVVASNLQEATAQTFEHELLKSWSSNYWTELRHDLETKRNRLVGILNKANISSIMPQGGYFLLADLSSLLSPSSPIYNQSQQQNGTTFQGIVESKSRISRNEQQDDENESQLDEDNSLDLSTLEELAQKWGLLAVPASLFYSPGRRNESVSALFNSPTLPPLSLSKLFRLCFIKSNETFDELEQLLLVNKLKSQTR